MIHFIEKILKGSHLSKIAPLLLQIVPLSLLLGIAWQVGMLSKINAVALFSWTQAINDTIALFPPILSGFAWYYLSRSSRKFQLKWWYGPIRVILVVISATLLWTILSMLAWKNYYLLLTVCTFLLGMLCFWVMYFSAKTSDSDWISEAIFHFLFPAAVMGLILLLLYLLMGIPGVIYSKLYEDMNITVSGATQNVYYLTDKYIFLSGGVVIPNGGEYKLQMKQ